jgi:signal transduction histidine kinase
MSSPAVNKELQEIHEKEKHLRFEKIAERSTYIITLGGFFALLLPFNFPVSRLVILLFLLLVLGASFVWFHLVPKKYVGPKKTLIYFFIAITFIFVGVHATGGVQSFAIFFFYFTLLRASAFTSLKNYIFLVLTVAILLLLESFVFSSFSFSQKINWSLVNLWALALLTVFSRYLFDQEKQVEESQESLGLKTAKQIDMVKNEFVFVVSKKLKEPILVLDNYLTMALKGIDQRWSEEMKDFLKKASQNTKRLSNLVSDLSDLSRIENQNLRLEIQKVSINEAVGSILSDFNIRAADKKITLNYQPSGQEIFIKADQSRLHEILANLVDNAIKYSRELSVVMISFSADNSFAQVNITDNGLGIPEEAKAHLFEKFYRVNREGNSPKGTGLGLFITKELIERQGGKIWFESQVNKGTNFHFTIPLAT